nr:hypothetical protein Itr_chr03CG11360 [Ipomoea trifida]
MVRHLLRRLGNSSRKFRLQSQNRLSTNCDMDLWMLVSRKPKAKDNHKQQSQLNHPKLAPRKGNNQFDVLADEGEAVDTVTKLKRKGRNTKSLANTPKVSHLPFINPPRITTTLFRPRQPGLPPATATLLPKMGEAVGVRRRQLGTKVEVLVAGVPQVAFRLPRLMTGLAV